MGVTNLTTEVRMPLEIDYTNFSANLYNSLEYAQVPPDRTDFNRYGKYYQRSWMREPAGTFSDHRAETYYRSKFANYGRKKTLLYYRYYDE